MKTRNKALLHSLCAVLLVATSVLGTMAYLTAEESVTNTFTVGKVSFDAESGLDEAKVDEYGDEVAGADRVKGNEYKLIPGHDYVKDPTIHIGDDSEACWIYAKVENGIADIEATSGTDMEDGGKYVTIVDQMIANGWSVVDGSIYAYKTTVSQGADVVIFNEFMVSGAASADELAANAEDTIVVTAYAIQADGFDTAADAWDEAGLE